MQVTHAVTLSEAKHYVSINQFDVCLLDNALVEALNGTFNVNYEGDQLHVMITFSTSPNTE